MFKYPKKYRHFINKQNNQGKNKYLNFFIIKNFIITLEYLKAIE